ncbi:MAG: protein kinase [Candidatus Brocadiae bacterium]|nr:protein kinase [Candidatus Brocadiia bacterium]
MSAISFLKSLDVFSSLSTPSFDRLGALVRARTYAAGDAIIRRGEPGDAMYIIHRGAVRIPILDPAGREKFVAALGPGDFFGEMSLMTGDPRSADVIADGPTDCLIIDKEIFQGLTRQHPGVSKFLTQILARRLSESDVMSSKTVGKYRLLGEIARGGMGIVYSGMQTSLNRTVAIKMLSHELSLDEEFGKRFRLEAQIIAALNHEHIVKVFDTESAYATIFIVMEYVEGTPLSKSVETAGHLTWDMCRRIIVQTASALQYAHERGIVHRDIKPGNIIITPEGNAKLMDFGIARVVTEQTENEEVIGTAEFMSPEQVRGKGVDGRADIYSLGIMAYKMTTGRCPFEDADPYVILKRHLRDPIAPPKDLDPKIPADLNAFILKAVEKDPARRYQSCSEIVKELSQRSSSTAPLSRTLRMLAVACPADQEAKVEALLKQAREQVVKLPGVSAAIQSLPGL